VIEWAERWFGRRTPTIKCCPSHPASSTFAPTCAARRCGAKQSGRSAMKILALEFFLAATERGLRGRTPDGTDAVTPAKSLRAGGGRHPVGDDPGSARRSRRGTRRCGMRPVGLGRVLTPASARRIALAQGWQLACATRCSADSVEGIATEAHANQAVSGRSLRGGRPNAPELLQSPITPSALRLAFEIRPLQLGPVRQCKRGADAGQIMAGPKPRGGLPGGAVVFPPR